MLEVQSELQLTINLQLINCVLIKHFYTDVKEDFLEGVGCMREFMVRIVILIPVCIFM